APRRASVQPVRPGGPGRARRPGARARQAGARRRAHRAGAASAGAFAAQRAEPEPVLAAPGGGTAAQGGGRGGVLDQERGRRAEPPQGGLKPARPLVREIDDPAAARSGIEARYEVGAGDLDLQALAADELDVRARQAGPPRLEGDPQPAARAADRGARVQPQAYALLFRFKAELHDGPSIGEPIVVGDRRGRLDISARLACAGRKGLQSGVVRLGGAPRAGTPGPGAGAGARAPPARSRGASFASRAGSPPLAGAAAPLPASAGAASPGSFLAGAALPASFRVPAASPPPAFASAASPAPSFVPRASPPPSPARATSAA